MDYGQSAYLSLFLDTDTSITARLTFRRFVLVHRANTWKHTPNARAIDLWLFGHD